MTESQRFSTLRSLPHVEIRYSQTQRTQEIEVYLGAQRLGSCVRIFKRGKESQRLFSITEAGITASNP